MRRCFHIRYSLNCLAVGAAAAVAAMISVTPPASAQKRAAASAAPPPKKKPAAPPVKPVKPAPVTVGLPSDAGPHDAVSTIEWWYFNSFLTTESGHKYAVVGSFFRTGLPGAKKGHYLIYSLTDLEENTQRAYSIIDQANLGLLKAFLPLVSVQRPNDPRPLKLLGQLQREELPAPHKLLNSVASVRRQPLFSIAFANNMFSQETADARTWKATLSGDDNWTLDLTLSQPEAVRPPMLVGGQGKTGLKKPDDMYYLSLTRMETTGTLTQEGVVEKVTGVGWVDRQWGRSWVVENNGWDWFGVQLDDGSDVIVYRIKDNATGKVLRTEATILQKNGTQIVDRAPVMRRLGTWNDKATNINFPAAFEVTLPTTGQTLTMTPAFPEQTIPVLGIGEAIWEGVVNVTGTTKAGTPITGRGYMELVGYQPGKKAPAAVPSRPPATNPKAVR